LIHSDSCLTFISKCAFTKFCNEMRLSYWLLYFSTYTREMCNIAVLLLQLLSIRSKLPFLFHRVLVFLSCFVSVLFLFCVQWRLVRGGRVGSAHPKPNDIFFLNLCILIFKFTNYLIDDLLLESKCFYRYIKTFPRRIFVRVDMSSLRGVR
jgi:hypothetical protein